MTQSAKQLATKLVGDGKRPNKWFVTIGYGWYFAKNSESAKQAVNPLESVTMLFETKEAAVQCYDSIHPVSGSTKITGQTIGQVSLEDRLTGVVKEKFTTDMGNGFFSLTHF